jgi:phenylacetate-CoA ligase
MTIELTARLVLARHRLGRHDAWSPERLARHQAAALARLRAHAVARSPFYRQLHAGLSSAPLEELPIVTKADIVAHRDEIAVDPRIRDELAASWLAEHAERPLGGRYWLVATSGSSGRPVTLAYDPAEWAEVLASFARGTDWAGLRVDPLGGVRIATVATTKPWHMSTRAAMTLPRPWVQTLRLDIADPLEDSIELLNGWRPAMLVTYPSIAAVLAAEQLAGRLRIAPTIVMCGAEVLSDTVRALVREAWPARLIDHYAASETGPIASECPAGGGLHLYEDQLIVEVVDDQNRPTPPGAFGDRLLVTVLFSRSLPLIRYELTDSIRLADGPCACGRPYRLVDRIAGRAEETLRLRAPGGRTVPVHPVVIHGVMDALRVGSWQVVASPERLVVRVTAPDPSLTRRLSTDLAAAIARLGATETVIDVERVAAIDRGPTGKQPLISFLPGAAPPTPVLVTHDQAGRAGPGR